MAEILKTQVFSKEQRNKRNYLIHLLYVRKEFDECLRLIEDTLAQVNEVCAHAPRARLRVHARSPHLSTALWLPCMCARVRATWN